MTKAEPSSEDEPGRSPSPVAEHRTLREVIAQTIRDGIIRGTFKPGQHITEPDLAERFGISRTPIREAFRQLESEGFLETTPRKGTVVAPVTERDVREFYEIKSLLEGHAARKAAARIGAEELAAMAAANERLIAAHRAGNLREMVAQHNEFHAIFVRASGNERLAQLIESLVLRFQRFRVLLSLSDAIEDFAGEHREIIRAFEAADAERAERLVRENARHGEEELVRRLAARGELAEHS